MPPLPMLIFWSRTATAFFPFIASTISFAGNGLKSLNLKSPAFIPFSLAFFTAAFPSVENESIIIKTYSASSII